MERINCSGCKRSTHCEIKAKGENSGVKGKDYMKYLSCMAQNTAGRIKEEKNCTHQER